jgi:hypothetical protein
MTGPLILCAVLATVAAGVIVVLRATGHVEVWPAVLLIASAPLEIYRAGVGGFNLSVFRLALVVVAVVTAVDLWRHRPSRIAVPIAFVAYALLVAIQLISLALVSTDRTLGYRFGSQYIAGLAAAALVAWWMRRAPVRVAAWSLVGAALLPIAAGAWRVIAVHGGHAAVLPGVGQLPVDASIAAARTGGSFLIDGRQRMVGTFADPNHFAFFVAVATVIAASLLIGEVTGPRRRPNVVALALALAIGEVALLVTYSRSAWLLTGVALAVLLVLVRRHIRPLVATRARVIALVAVATVAAAAEAPLVIQRINPDNPGTRLSTEAHGRTMRLALDLLADHPLTGVGIGSYGSHAGQPALVSSAHSTILTVAAETGFPGLVALLTAMLLTVALGIVAVQRARDPGTLIALGGLVAAYVGLVCANLVYEVWMDDFQWMLFGAIVGATAQLLAPAAPRRGFWFPGARVAE